MRLEGDVTNDALAAGGNVTLSGAVGGTARIAGGSIIIQSAIINDLVVAGGTIDITREASVGGDLVIAGGTLRINGPVKGNIWVTGGNIEINSIVGGSVYGAEIGQLRLGPNAVINGNLDYTAEEKANIAQGAVVKGKQNFKQEEHGPSEKEAAGAIAGIATAGTIFKLITAILVSFFAIWLLPRFFTRNNELIAADPLKTGLLGFAALILMPILSLILLLLFWIGVASFLLYAFLLVVSIVVVYIFVGWILAGGMEGIKSDTSSTGWRALSDQ